VAGLLSDDVAANVLGGNAMRVYAGMPQLPVRVGVDVDVDVDAARTQRKEP
jgi:hypothetical protein